MPQKIVKSFPRVQKLPARYRKHDNSEWAIASLEVVDREGDVIRVDGIDCPVGTPVQCQHMAYAPDGSPTTIARIIEVHKDRMPWDGRMVPALIVRFEWAPSKLASEYRELWPDFISSVSISARFGKEDAKRTSTGLDVLRCSMGELSVVSFGANQGATALKGLSFDGDDDEVSQEEWEELEERIEELKQRVSILSVEQRLEELKKELA